eukprot:gene15989-18032_t
MPSCFLLFVYTLSFIRSISAEDPKYLNFIGAVGSGYDPYYGNPRCTNPTQGLDPGFRTSIYNVSIYTGKQATPDWRYWVPDGLDVKECGTYCTASFNTAVMAGSYDYQQSLDESISFSASGLGARFEASEDFQSVYEMSYTYGDVYTDASATCCVYVATILYFAPPPFTTSFQNAVALMPTTFDEKDEFWSEFFKSFGTSVIVGPVNFGSRYGQITQMSKYSYSSFSSSTISIQEGASYSALSMTASASTMTTEQQSTATAFKSFSKSQSTYMRGGVYSNQAASWFNSSTEYPVPILYTLDSISSKLTSGNFPGDSQISAKAKALDTATTNYCQKLLSQGMLVSCNELPQDPPLPSSSNFGGMYTVDDCGSYVPNPYTGNKNCPNGFNHYKVGRTLHPESKCGQVMYICLNSLKDPLDEFGGVYEKADIHQDDTTINPVTGGLSCPEGYNRIDLGRASTAEPKGEGCMNFYCYKPSLPLGESPWGGFYQKADVGSKNNIANYFTGTTSCPQGYYPYPVARQYAPEGRCGAMQYVCLNNIF